MAQDQVSPSDVDVTIQADADCVVLVVQGEIDMSSVAPLEAYLARVAADSFEAVVVDLAGVTFMDSSGLAVLARTGRSFAGTGRSFAVRNPTPSVQRVLHIAGLDTLLHEP